MSSYRIRGVDVSIVPCNGVYEPSDDTFLVMENADPSGDVLEMGTGSGIIAIFLAILGYNVVGADINMQAIKCAESNAKLNNCRVHFRQSDLFSQVPESFDTIIFNPPYLPSDDRIPGSEQWDGGPDGFRVLRPFLSELPGHLKEKGRAYVVLSSFTDIASLILEFSNCSFQPVKDVSFTFETLFLYRIGLK